MRHLKAFHVFHVAAHSTSYSEAAEKLNITHGAVSKQIKVLENHLSQTLFYKQGRNVCLTKEGELLKGYTEQAFQALDTGVQKLNQLNNHALEVSCEPTLTMRWLMPRLGDFYAESGIDVRLSTAGGAVNLDATGLDMAIRRDDFKLTESYEQIPLVEEWVGPVCSPDYWQQVKNNLGDVKLLHSNTRLNAWSDWGAITEDTGNSGELSKSAANQTFAHFYFCFQAAVDGLGIALGSYPLIADDIERGNLIAPFSFVPSGHQYILLTQDSNQDESGSSFVTWLKSELSQCVPVIKN
ncbi:MULTISPECIES: LysR family transcriptional regulator [unclassified Vibrio]|uniref:LysR family transcriptional regulator n=1 Tax=unclassified Vibrio TaxID=2614977 RepID=UPI00159CF676|nr:MULTISPECIES: LysR family transcriptional regulator [unclassified Vibrio]NVN80672.1 LysR family transcriptional regulator [Vibrio sp. Scap16]QLE95523.1 LysR family transcriptional regulator [Vibrio sp. Scap24]